MNNAMQATQVAHGSPSKQSSRAEQTNMRLSNLLSDNQRILTRLEDVLIRLRGSRPLAVCDGKPDMPSPISHFGKMDDTIDDLFRVEGRSREILAELEELI